MDVQVPVYRLRLKVNRCSVGWSCVNRLVERMIVPADGSSLRMGCWFLMRL